MKKPWTAGFEIPKVIHLPGVRVRVRVMPADAPQIQGYDARWIYDPDGTATILLDGGLPVECQRWFLIHELLHAVHDVREVFVNDHPEHVQTKSMAQMNAYIQEADAKWRAAQVMSAREADAPSVQSAPDTATAPNE